MPDAEIAERLAEVERALARSVRLAQGGADEREWAAQDAEEALMRLRGLIEDLAGAMVSR